MEKVHDLPWYVEEGLQHKAWYFEISIQAKVTRKQIILCFWLWRGNIFRSIFYFSSGFLVFTNHLVCVTCCFGVPKMFRIFIFQFTQWRRQKSYKSCTQNFQINQSDSCLGSSNSCLNHATYDLLIQRCKIQPNLQVRLVCLRLFFD